MRDTRPVNVAYRLAILLLLTLSTGSLAWAGTMSACGSGDCTWEISVDGAPVMNGMYMADADGNIILNSPVSGGGEGYTFSLDSMSGNIDPVLGFGLGATNTSGSLKTFAFAFSLPLGGLPAPINTAATLGTTLTAFTSAGGSVFPTLGGGRIMDSQDLVLSPFASVDKGVDIGLGLVIPSSSPPLTTVTNSENATGSIASGGPYDLMSVVVAFGLTDQTGVGFSGAVSQIAVPEPAAFWLVGPVLLGLVGIARRKATA